MAIALHSEQEGRKKHEETDSMKNGARLLINLLPVIACVKTM
jgi:hypothetical protein